MAEKKVEKKKESIEREYVIPLREKCRNVARYKKTPKAVKTVKEFLVRHMKIRDGDLNKIKIDTYLNEQLWIRGIKKSLYKVKVKAVKEGDIVRVYAMDLPERIKFKKLREEKGEIKAKADAEKQKSLMDKAKESIKGKKEDDEEPTKESTEEKTVEEKNEEKEKEETSKLAQEKIDKESAKKMKHTTKVETSKQVKNLAKTQNKTSRGH